MQAGVFDPLFAQPAHDAVTVSSRRAIDPAGTDPQIPRDGGIVGLPDETGRGGGLKSVAAPATGTLGFRSVPEEPIDGAPAFEGREIRGAVS